MAVAGCHRSTPHWRCKGVNERCEVLANYSHLQGPPSLPSSMADDDLDLMQSLLEMADDDDAITDSPEATARPAKPGCHSFHTTHAENAPPNKRARIISARPLAEGKYERNCIFVYIWP